MKISAIFISIFLTGCYLSADPNSSADFYKNYSEWDIQYVPIVDPIRVYSINKGKTWNLDIDIFHGDEIKSFGISENYIYGQLEKYCVDCENKWFLYDINSKLWAEYKSQTQLFYTLKYFDIKANDIKSCNAYFDQLIKGGRCNWYPPTGKKYIVNTSSYRKNIDTIFIGGGKDNVPKLNVKLSVNTNRTEIYFYKVIVEKGLFDSLYISVDNRYDTNPNYTMVTDSMILPVNVPHSEYQLTLYTPFETAKRRHLPDNIFDTVVVRRVDRY